MIVVGAGAGGMMAAGRAAERGAKVLLLEKTDGPGKKILISGKSRCNLTNARDLDDFISMYGPNGRFLHGAFRRFFREDLLAFLGRYGVETKVERGGRIFPVSDDAADVVKAFRRYLKDQRRRSPDRRPCDGNRRPRRPRRRGPDGKGSASRPRRDPRDRRRHLAGDRFHRRRLPDGGQPSAIP